MEIMLTKAANENDTLHTKIGLQNITLRKIVKKRQIHSTHNMCHPCNLFEIYILHKDLQAHII